MLHNLNTWEDTFSERVYVHSPTREAEAVYKEAPSWGVGLPIDDVHLEVIMGRQARRRPIRNWELFGRTVRGVSDYVEEVDTFTEDLPAHEPIIRLVSSGAIGPTELPDMLSPQMANIVRIVGEPIVIPARPKDPIPSLPSEINVLISALKVYGHESTAATIQDFLAIRDVDPDEPPIIRESLLSLVQFLIQELQLLPPVVSSDLDGLMELEWHLLDNGDLNTIWGRGNGVVSLKFLKSGNIQYVALSGPKRRGQDRLRLHGEATKCEMLAELGEFAQKITTS